MSLPEAFWTSLPRKTNEELQQILAKPEDYLPEAVQAARDELIRRNVPTPEVRVPAQVQSGEVSAAKEKNGAGLVAGVVLLCVVIGFVVMNGAKESESRSPFSEKRREDLSRSGMAFREMTARMEAEKEGKILVVSKTCEACQKVVSGSATVGDTCPHCGVRWNRGSFNNGGSKQ